MKRGRDDDEEASTPIFASDHAEVVSRLAADAKKKQETLEALKTTIEERGKPSTPLVAAPAASFHRIVVRHVNLLKFGVSTVFPCVVTL